MHNNKKIPSPPGIEIKQQLKLKNISVSDFAKSINMSKKECFDILNGNMLLTRTICFKIGSVLDIPAQHLLNLENQYRQDLIDYYLNKRRKEM